ncbi:hypothetical protein [Cryobacterium sp. TMT2-4]|uniref:hypothetical protein n=1 Tax=Cryobacterium sp. TMT2-4 TaxID=1259254 RepID=UPI00106C06D4|nr:hypothetical protein [Cryobacterium sp. TMT2-4]TFC67742.1 hypothetical protein E3O54_07930 [Cryobacterium sp. TMT2-4]
MAKTLSIRDNPARAQTLKKLQDSRWHDDNSSIATEIGRENPFNQKSLPRGLRSDFFLFRPDHFVKSFANGPLVGRLRKAVGHGSRKIAEGVFLHDFWIFLHLTKPLYAAVARWGIST